MVSNNCPSRVWYFGLKNPVKVIQMIPSVKLNERMPIKAVKEETLDISKYIDFYLYYLAWYHTVNHPIGSNEHRSLGR